MQSAMRAHYDLSQGKRGRIATAQPDSEGRTRLTIGIDDDLLEYFLKAADASGGKVHYWTLVNDALRQFIEGKAPQLEETLRRIVREEIQAAS